LACSGPTAREADEDAELIRQQIEVIRQRIDPEGKQELGIEFVGGNRIEITIPPERIEELRRQAERREREGPPTSSEEVTRLIRAAAVDQQPDSQEMLAKLRALGYIAVGTDDAEIERVLARLDECPEAGIAFHVPYGKDGYASSVKVPEGHAIDLRSNGSIWCGDMRLADSMRDDDRLLEFHLEEIARCARTMVRADWMLLTMDVHLHPGASFDPLRRLLQAAARPETAITEFRFLSTRDGEVDVLNYRLPVDEASGTAFGVQYLDVRVTVEFDERGNRAVQVALKGPTGGAEMRGTHIDAKFARPFLERTFEADCDVRAVIDVGPGVLYQDVNALLDALIRAGLTHISFVGRR
ncbi:MAG TPA: hypothetical protein PKI99_09440, partial [Terrimesophilobacter sp.]|nr:hypothetical protein [Terrimesophilobacter sp.]